MTGTVLGVCHIMIRRICSVQKLMVREKQKIYNKWDKGSDRDTPR